MSTGSPLVPLFQDQQPYLLNRMLFSLLPVLMIVYTSPQIIMFGLHKVQESPTLETVRQAILSVFQESRTFTLIQTDQTRQEYSFLKNQLLPQLVSREDSRIERVHASNNKVLDEWGRWNNFTITSLQVLRDEIAERNGMGQEIRYHPNATPDDIERFQTSFGIIHGVDVVRNFGEASSVLKDSIEARYDYDREYFLNKTQSLLLSLPSIQTSLQVGILFDDPLRLSLADTRESLRVLLLIVRNYLEQIYSELKAHLLETRTEFDELLEAYEELYRDAKALVDAILQSGIPLIEQLLDIPDLSRYDPSILFDIPLLTPPPVEEFLEQLDILIGNLNTTFDLLGDRIIFDLNVAVNASIDGVIDKLRNLALLTDYMPPPITFGGEELTPAEAFAVDRELVANLTETEVDRLVENIPMVELEMPEIEAPTIDLDEDTFSFAQSVLEQLEVFFSFEVPLAVRKVLDFVVMVFLGWPGVSFTIFFRSYRQVLKYWSGSAVPTPIVEMRTKAEIEAEKKRTKKATAAVIGAKILANRHVYYGVSYGLVFILSFAVLVFAANYQRTQFQPKCILSNQGTPLATATIFPIIVNRGLITVFAEQTRLSLQLRALANDRCRRLGRNSLARFADATIEYEALRAAALVAANQVDLARRVLFDVTDVCSAQNRVACELVQDQVLLSSELNSNVLNCSNLHPGDIGNAIDLRSLPIDAVKISEKVCIVEWWVLSHFWTFCGLVGSFVVLFLARYCLIEGLHILQRRFLRPEEFHINSTCHRNGLFTQPEYDSENEREEAIANHVKRIVLRGWVLLVSGVLLFLFYSGVGVYLVLTLRSRPVWWNPTE